MCTARDLSVYLVTDPALGGNRPLEEIVAAAIAGGVTIVQLRDPHAPTRQLVETAKRLKAVTRAAGVPLVINDRVDVALAIGADGVHLGQSDMDARDARRLLGPEALIGLSVGTPAEFERSRAALDVVDYVGVGAIFATATKPDVGAAIGLTGLADMRRRLTLPIVAIGGIDRARAAGCIAAGADGVAVVSALMAADDPAAAAGDLRSAVAEGRR